MQSLRYNIRPVLIYCLTLFAVASSAIQAAELFIADQTANRILSFDEVTGEFIRVVTASGLDVPTGLTFGPGGFLYATNLVSGFPGSAASVVKIDPVTGTTTPFITDVGGAGGITYHSASDTLFVSEIGQFNGDEVFRYDAGGSLLQTLGTNSAGTGRAGMTFDSAGNLYVSEFNFTGFGSVLKYDAPVGSPSNDFGTTATPFASGASVTLNFPAFGFNGLAFDDAGDLYVASLIGQAVIKYTVSGGVVIGEGAQFGASVPYPSGFLVETNGNLLTTSLGNNNPMDPFYGDTLLPGKVLRIDTSLGTSVDLLTSEEPADLDGDGSVDGSDLVDWQDAYSVDAMGDIDGDEDSDGNDFLAWQRAYENQVILQPTAIVRYDPLANTLAVPEPASLCLILLGAATLTLNRQNSVGRNKR
ncbi:hypothetical protein [Bythopirellula polymerisocia]|uniref:hypothetical protein n=1 Tax=Bythopirellula polymerisocia TaxID=2528003 RepID=UPI0011B66350|nr:hypothetical protein [Bythopirellula polymerisocia]